MSMWTIDSLIECKNRSSASINESGTLAVYTFSQYSIEKKDRAGGLILLDIVAKQEVVLIDEKNVKEPVWSSDNSIFYVVTKDNKSCLRQLDVISKKDAEVISFPYSIEHITYEHNHLAYCAKVDLTGIPIDAAKLQELQSQDALVYDSLYVRHWDEWKTYARNAIFIAKVDLSNPVDFVAKNYLLDYNLESPVGPFGGAGDYTLSSTHIAFAARDPHVNPAWTTKINIYLVALDGSGELHRLDTTDGEASIPRFNSAGTHLAWLERRTPGYEADRNQIVLYDVQSGTKIELCPDWDRSPHELRWSKSQDILYILAKEYGCSKLWYKGIAAHRSRSHPILVSTKHDVTAFTTSLTSLLITSTSMARQFHLSTLLSGQDRETVLHPGTMTGICDKSTEEFWFDSKDRKVHGWLIKPDCFDASKKYPMLFLIHGGPQGSWDDRWAPRWHMHTFANYGTGFICVAINPTGSTSYGQQFCDDIKEHWGDRPYDDLEAGFNHVLKQYAFIDPQRCAAAGASYGGYMINWMQGHPFGRRFKALVCHDGIFSTPYIFYGGEELFFPEHDFGGVPWDTKAREIYEKWNPANFVHEWATPQLVIHGSCDYRLPESESIAAFNALQRRGVPSRLLIFKSENHFVQKPLNSKIWYETVMGWVEKWTTLT